MCEIVSDTIIPDQVKVVDVTSSAGSGVVSGRIRKTVGDLDCQSVPKELKLLLGYYVMGLFGTRLDSKEEL